jgi:hydroxyacylglutathione hydrolase
MFIQQFFIDGLGHGSYLVADDSSGVAAVIDPRRDFDVYLTAAQQAGLSIQHVLETHTHNDYVSGAKELARVTGAQLWASGANGGAGLKYAFRPVVEGSEIEIGEVTLRVWETPGHTSEHVAYVAYEGDPSASPVAVFTGGSLMVGGAGRSDLSGAGRTEALTRSQYENLRRLLALDAGTQVFPTHGGGSFCGGAGGGARWSTIGQERSSNPLAKHILTGDAAAFASALLDALPVIPAYWPRMRPVNMAGPAPLSELGVAGHGGVLPPLALDPRKVQELLDKDAVYVVDARDPAGFGGAHIAGSFGIGLGSSFGIWAGSVVPDDRPLVLVLPGSEAGSGTATGAAWEEAVRQLLRAGYDRVAGYLAGGLRAWAVEGLPFATVEQVSATDAWERISRGEASLLDVRQPKEWRDGHVPRAIHIPGASLSGRSDELDKGRPWAVACSTGYRSTIAASVLRRAGFRQVVNVLGGMTAWETQQLPQETPGEAIPIAA